MTPIRVGAMRTKEFFRLPLLRNHSLYQQLLIHSLPESHFSS